MKIDKLIILKKRLIKLGCINVCVIMLAYSGYYVSGEMKIEKLDIQTKTKSEILTINSESFSLESKINEAKEATKLWSRFNQNDKKGDGLEIDKAKSIIKYVESQYLLSKPIDVNLSTPVELKDIYQTDTTVVVSSDVTLKISAVSDEIIISLIDSTLKNFPGFTRIKTITFNKVTDLTNEIIAVINRGNDDLPVIVEGVVVFEWRDLKYLNKDKAKTI